MGADASPAMGASAIGLASRPADGRAVIPAQIGQTMNGRAAPYPRNTLTRPPENPVFLAVRPGPVTGSSDAVEYCLTNAFGAVLLNCIVEWRARIDTVSGLEASCHEARAVMSLLRAQVRRRDVVIDDQTDAPALYPLDFLAAANSVSRLPAPSPQAVAAMAPMTPSPALVACAVMLSRWRGRKAERDASPAAAPPLSRLSIPAARSLLQALLLTGVIMLGVAAAALILLAAALLLTG